MSQTPRFPSSSLPIVWEVSQGQPKALGSCTLVGDSDKVPGSWLQIGSAPAVVATWEVNKQMEDLPLGLSFL